MPNVIEEAKSGRAACRTCKTPIAKGELRLGVEVATQFAESSLQWHHLPCAASKLPAELKEALDAYPGEVANRAELDAAMADAIKKGHAKPAGYPFVDRAPTGRARCIQCQQAIAKDALRVAVERELDTGAMVTRAARYMHPACAAANVEAAGESLDELVEGLRKNSRISDEDLASALAEIQPG